MKKEIRKELDWIRNLDSTYKSEVKVIKNKGHLKFRWYAVDSSQQLQTCTVVLGSTPSCPRWVKNHRRNVKKILSEKNISIL